MPYIANMKQATTKHNVSEIFLMQNDIGSLYMQFVLLSIIFYRAFLVSKIRKSVSMKKLYFLFIFFTTVPRHDTSIARWKKSRRVTKWSGYLTPSESFQLTQVITTLGWTKVVWFTRDFNETLNFTNLRCICSQCADRVI